MRPCRRGHGLPYPSKLMTRRMNTLSGGRTVINKIAKERKKHGGVDAYKDELDAMVESKKALAAKRKEDGTAKWNELKCLEDEKWRSKLVAEERKVKQEERRIALKEERLAKDKKAEERVIMFMDPNAMDATARKYWELTRLKIIAQSEASRGGDGGGHGGDGGVYGGDDGGGRGGGDVFFGDDEHESALNVQPKHAFGRAESTT